jgi:hypothetical protein
LPGIAPPFTTPLKSIRTWMSRDGLSNTMLEAGFVDARYIR